MDTWDRIRKQRLEARHLSRRDLLGVGGAAAGLGLAAALGGGETAAQAARGEKGFSFAHITDIHIQPERGATEGVARAFAALRGLKEKPDFALIGGDLVMDANLVDAARADLVFAEWRQAAADLNLPCHYAIGNHDLYAIGSKTVSPRPGDADYGKTLFKKRAGVEQTWETFDHNGWRFVILDSVGMLPPDSPTPDGRFWEGVLGDDQLAFLDRVLAQTPKTMPLVFLTHFPIVTGFLLYAPEGQGATPAPRDALTVKNGKAFVDRIGGYNVKAVLQGHTHVVEEVTYRGVRYITGGAVCGDWWKGPRLGVHPEGFGIFTVRGENLSWRYVPYGWRVVDG